MRGLIAILLFLLPAIVFEHTLYRSGTGGAISASDAKTTNSQPNPGPAARSQSAAGRIASVNDWPVWRGPSGNNIAIAGQNLPTQISKTENVLWKVRVPGEGHSSPILVGDRLFLATSEREDASQSVLCFDRNTGKQLWKTIVNRGGLPKIHKANTHASSTLAYNGESLFALFDNHERLQLVSLTTDGKILKQVSAGPFKPVKYQFGVGVSPLLYKSLVIVSLEYEQGELVAFDQKTLKRVWQADRKVNSYSSPIVATISGRDLLLITGSEQVDAYDPLTGKHLWKAPGTSAATCGTVAWEGDMIFASGGFPQSDTVGLRIKDNMPEVVWNHKERCYEQSLLAYNGYVYAVNEAGIAFCWRAKDGEQMWKTRLCGPTSASPIVADGVIYQIDERGKFVAFRSNPEKFEKVFEVQLGDSGFATPTICHGRMYCRVADQTDEGRVETLYCFGLPETSTSP